MQSDESVDGVGPAAGAADAGMQRNNASTLLAPPSHRLLCKVSCLPHRSHVPSFLDQAYVVALLVALVETLDPKAGVVCAIDTERETSRARALHGCTVAAARCLARAFELTAWTGVLGSQVFVANRTVHSAGGKKLWIEIGQHLWFVASSTAFGSVGSLVRDRRTECNADASMESGAGAISAC